MRKAWSQETTELSIQNRPLNIAVLKKSWIAVCVPVLIFASASSLSAGGGNGVAPSFIGCMIGLAIVRFIIMKDCDPLDQLRWKRFWHGALLGYYLTYMPLTFISVVAVLSNENSVDLDDLMALSFVSDLVIFGVASIIGFYSGVHNMRKKDGESKAASMAEFSKVSKPTVKT